MADSTIANLTDGTTANATDRIPVERSPFGAGTNRYITPAYLATLLGIGGLTSTRVPVMGGSGALVDYANLTYSEASGPRLQVGSGGTTSAGWVAGYYGSSGYAALWNTGVAPGATNFTLASASTTTVLSSPNSGTVEIQKGGGTRVALLGGTSGGTAVAGAGLYVTAGTATTDVQALSATQTWNAAGVPFTAEKTTVTMTAFHAGSLVRDWRNAGGSLFAIHNTGAFGGVGTTYANRPSAPWTGCIHNITDSNTATWGATIAGGGANNVLARYNGANWTVVGA